MRSLEAGSGQAERGTINGPLGKRNGYFVPRKVEVFSDVRGQVNLWVFSRQVGKTEPISLRVSRQDAASLGKQLLDLGGIRKVSSFERRSPHE